jgi:type II secretory pathway component PulM
LLVLVALALGALLAWRLQDAIARSREDLSRNRLMLDIARARAAENATLMRANVAPKPDDVRSAIDRVLAANGLRYTAVGPHRDDGAQQVVVEAAPFDALIRALDTLAREEGVRVVDASIAARIEPGTVRAEIAFTR